MPDQKLLKKYADLIVKVGVNVQHNQPVVIRATTENKQLVRELTKSAYQAGAKQVFTLFSDDIVTHSTITYATVETLTDIPDYLVAQYQHFVNIGACFISVTSPVPGLNNDLDPYKLQQQAIASQQKLAFFSQHTMANKAQWCVVAGANQTWGEAVFAGLKGDEATEKLWSAIFTACRVDLTSDPVKNWAIHNKNLSKYNQKLNELNFKSLRFTNSLGTDLTVELIKDHVWAGGNETAGNGTIFNPNMPTEEAFTMPYKFGTQGRVYSTKPLNYQGKLIDEFYLDFKDGQVVGFDAKKEKETLANLLNMDEGAKYIGEVALISHDTPISKTNIVFLNTLFDENASCHLALGRAYPMNIKNGVKMTQDELIKLGYNHSNIHVDFMFGSSDMKIVAVKQDGSEFILFEKGNFVI